MPPTLDSVIRLVLPTPFPVGPVNAWWLDGPEPVLIDAGVYTEVSLAALEAQLAARGRRLADVRRLLLTHDHHDHAGAAGEVAARSGATLHLHRESRLAARWPDEEVAAVAAFLLRCGMPLDVLARLGEAFRGGGRVSRTPSDAVPTVRLAGGETIDSPLGPLTAIATPGHSPDHLCYLAPEAGVIFSGDTLLRDITPNPLLHLDPAAGYQRLPSLLRYLASIDALEALQVPVALPGHGPDIDDVGALIQSTRAFVKARQTRFHRAMLEGATTPWALARALFGDQDPAGCFLALSETVAHLDLLERDGRVAVDWEGEPVRLRALPRTTTG
jgi:glyoxylase-like metal-dependent hydrolase (beta-lactamase superfamily II)